MTKVKDFSRRTVLKTIGAGVVGSAAVAGVASAGEPDDNRRNDSYTWAHDTVYEMQVTEPVIEDPQTGELLNPDSEGSHEGMRPLYVVAPQDDEHSPHDTFGGLTFDHVIYLKPGKKFYSAQWHTHFVLNNPPASPADLAKTGINDAPLTSESAILAAAKAGEVIVVPAFTESGDPGAFTCPVRPHTHKKTQNK